MPTRNPAPPSSIIWPCARGNSGLSDKPDSTPRAIKTPSAVPKTALAATAAPPAPPKEEPPVNREEIQGNLYINHEFGFRIFKAPSWQLIDGAGQTLPNAIMAMGTSNESTLLVVAQEKTKHLSMLPQKPLKNASMRFMTITG